MLHIFKGKRKKMFDINKQVQRKIGSGSTLILPVLKSQLLGFPAGTEQNHIKSIR